MKPWLIVLMALLYASVPALGQGSRHCAPAKAVRDYLTGKDFEEVPVFDMTILPDGRIPVQFFANPKTGTWSIVVFYKGMACIAMAGYHIQPMKLPVDKPL